MRCRVIFEKKFSTAKAFSLVPQNERLASAGFNWPLPADMTDAALEVALFAAAGTRQGHCRHAEPDWAELYREFKRKHVTLTMLWDEYIERCPEGYRHSRFCELYRGRASRLSARCGKPISVATSCLSTRCR
jgi:transposase